MQSQLLKVWRSQGVSTFANAVRAWEHCGMDDSITITSRFGRILSIGTAVIVIGGLVSIAISSGLTGLLRDGWPLAFIGFATWALFWKPRMLITGGGVTFYNVLRTVYIPWLAITDIDTKYALTLVTAAPNGTGTARHTAWAAPAPTRYSARGLNKQELRALPPSTFLADTVRPGDLPSTDSGYAAQLIRTRWESVRSTGSGGPHLTGEALIEQPVVTRTHWRIIVVGGVLATAAVISLLVSH